MQIPFLRRGAVRSSNPRASAAVPPAILLEQTSTVVQLVIDAIDALVVVALPEGSLWLWNQRCDETSGTPLAAVAGQPIWSVMRLRTNFLAVAQEALERLVSGAERSVEFQAQWLRKDGRKARVSWIARLVDLDGFRFVVATGAETTRGRKAAREIAETESRFETLLEVLPDPVVIHQNGRAVFVNRAALELYGAESTAVAMARPLMNWVADESRPLVAERVRRMLTEGVAMPLAEETHLKFDGTPFDVEVFAAPVTFDGRPAVELVARDVTARKKAETDLQASEARVRAVFDQSSLGMVVVGRDGVILESNAAMERLLGYDKSEFAQLRVADFTHPADRDESQRLMGDMFLGKNDGFQTEKRYLTKEGREVWARVHVAMVRDGSGRPQLAVSTVEDTTGHRALEDQLRQASKMEALGRLAGGVAHDFNNLLTVVNGYADLLVLALEGDERVSDAIEIRRAGSRATELTAQMLAFGRRSKHAVEPVELNDRIEALLPMLRRLLGEDIEVDVAFDRSVGAVEADPSQLDQLVMNLVVNSRDAMPGGGSVRLTTHLLDPEVSGREGAIGWAVLEIADTGIGMAPEVLEHIFEPFFTTKSKGKGTGLGLATVYGIVQQMAGFIRVDSNVGEGSRFIIELPLCEGAASRPSARITDDLPIARAHESILLIEDEPTVRDFCKRALEAEGYRVSVGGPRDALEMSARLGSDLDLLVTDVVMPDFDGPTIAAALTSSRRGLRVLFMSGYPRDREEELVGAVAEGALLTKPFTPRELCDAVRRALNKPSPADTPRGANAVAADTGRIEDESGLPAN
jgi:two-component system, cell cycle sensor histidine kinase and response regulator CckA